GRLGQVFLNLLVNAVQAIPDGSPTDHEIRIVTRMERGRVLVEIGDDGLGIPAEILPRIFDPFFTTKPIGVGTGLGLAICHGIVAAMNGEITVETELGRGTTFLVSLPAATQEARVRPAPSPRARAVLDGARAGDARLRVLVVDDEPALSRALTHILSPTCEVAQAHGGSEALEMLEHDDRFDIIFCDLVMPEVSGMDVYERIEASRPALAQRFAFMTGGAFTARARDFLERTQNPCIAKPFDLEELAALLRRVKRRS